MGRQRPLIPAGATEETPRPTLSLPPLPVGSTIPRALSSLPKVNSPGHPP